MKHTLFTFLLLIGFQAFAQNKDVLSTVAFSRAKSIEVIDKIPTLIRTHYVDSSQGIKLAQLVERNVRLFSNISSPNSLADSLTRFLQKVSGDKHLFVQVLPQESPADVTNWDSLERKQEIFQNFGFTKLEILDHETAYLKITEFMHPGRSFPTAMAAMRLVENSKNLIIDLRGNSGGYPGIMEYILNHYFSGPPLLLSKTVRRDRSYTTNYSSDLLATPSRDGTPLYVLIDKGTASAAEYFAYTLQSFGKAVIIGRSSAGGAFRTDFFELPHNFRISISVAQPVNEITKGNWEGKGVQPNVVSDHPLETALEIISGKKSERPIQ